MILYFISTALFCALIIPAVNPSIASLLFSSSLHSKLGFSPNHLRIRQIILIIVVLASKSVQRVLGLVPKLKRSSSSKDLSTAYSLPDVRLSMPISLSGDDAIIFDEALDLKSASKKDLSAYSHDLFFLGGLTTPLMLLLLAKRSCPILPLGSVNVRNRFEFWKPELCRLAAQGQIIQGFAQSRLVQAGRRVKRGVEFDVIVDITATMEDQPEPQVIFRSIITLLQFLPRSALPKYTEPDSETKAATASCPQPTDYLTLDRKLQISYDEPAYWAAFCKDYNPIHVSSWLAKLFGFPSKISHGNLVAAKAMVLLGRVSGTHFNQMWTSPDRPSWLEMEYKRPTVVPAELEVQMGESEESQAPVGFFKVSRGPKVYVEGKAGWLE